MDREISPKNEKRTKHALMIINGDYAFRRGITSIINDITTYELVGEASSRTQALKLVRKNKPDMVVAAVSQTDQRFLKAMKEIRRIRAHVKMLIVSKHSDAVFISNAFQGGVNGCVVEDSGPEKIMRGCSAKLRNELHRN